MVLWDTSTPPQAAVQRCHLPLTSPVIRLPFVLDEEVACVCYFPRDVSNYS